METSHVYTAVCSPQIARLDPTAFEERKLATPRHVRTFRTIVVDYTAVFFRRLYDRCDSRDEHANRFSGPTMTGADDLALLEEYSDLHDAEILDFAFSRPELKFRMVLFAERFKTATWEQLTIEFSAVTRLEILQGPDWPRFQDFVFPVSGLLDGFTADNQSAVKRVTLLGTYGWKIVVECASISLDVSRETL
jgi:hypothetical protein